MESIKRSRLLDFDGFPCRWDITRSNEETHGDFQEMRFEVDSTTGASPPLHIHPGAEERYEVISGVLEVNVEGDSPGSRR